MRPPIAWSLCLLLVLAVFLQARGGAGAGQDLAADDSIVVKGTIKEVTSYEPMGNLVGEILVEVDSKGKYRFLLRKDTKILQENAKPALWPNLRIEQRVSVTYNGVVIRTRPPQAGADQIAIESQPKSGTPR
jgi:hypothetical protein